MEISYKTSPKVTDDELNNLNSSVWDDHELTKYQNVLSRSFIYICAYSDKLLVGFVNVAWDGNEHGFLIDTIVRKEFHRKGIGTQLVNNAILECKKRGLKWLHVDFLPHLTSFYQNCGFQHTEAGLIRLNQKSTTDIGHSKEK